MSGIAPPTRAKQPNARMPTRSKEEVAALAHVKAINRPGISNKECVEEYSRNAANYEQHWEILGFKAAQNATKVAVSVLKDFKDARILDAGAGTGVGGLMLHNLGYTNMDAVDASGAMLELAKAKNIYTNIMCHFLGATPMPVDDDTYDIVVLAGCVGENHLPLTAFDDFIRVVKPGGHAAMVFNANAGRDACYGPGGVEGHFAEQEKKGKWKQISRILVPDYLVETEGTSGTEGVALIYQIL